MKKTVAKQNTPVTVSSVLSAMQAPSVAEVKKTPDEQKARLFKMIMRMIDNGGAQAEAASVALSTEEKRQEFAEAVRKFIDKIPEVLLEVTRVFVTSSARANFRIDAQNGLIVAEDEFTIVLEKDNNREDGYVVRVILNQEPITLGWLSFFEELDFRNVKLSTMDLLLKLVDSHGGFTVEQLTKNEFAERYGDRSDFIDFAEDTIGVFDGGKLVLTHKLWERSVSLRMPADGARPWQYHFEKDLDGRRKSASFRVNLYGKLWYRKQKEE